MSLRKVDYWIVSGLIAFLALVVTVLDGASAQIDRNLFLDIALWVRSRPAVMVFLGNLSALAEPVVRMPLAILLIGALLFVRRVRLALFVLIATLGGAALCSLIKAETMRARPTLIPQFDIAASYSFPSGHAWNGAIFYGAVALVAARGSAGWKRVAIFVATAMLVFLTGVSRIALGVHWPTDVFAGWIGGVTWLMLCYRMIVPVRSFPR